MTLEEAIAKIKAADARIKELEALVPVLSPFERIMKHKFPEIQRHMEIVAGTLMVWDGGRWTPIPSETFPAVPSTNLFDFSFCDDEPNQNTQ